MFLFVVISLFSSDDKKEENEEEKITSIKEDRREVLLYGIDLEVKELISKLTKEKIDGFDNELKSLLESTYDETIKIAILEYFKVMEIGAGEDEALLIFDSIEYEDEYTTKYAQVTISYLSEINSPEAIKRSKSLLDLEKNEIVIAALKLLGDNQVTDVEDKLITMLNEDETDDFIYLEVIKTLGKIKSNKAIEELIPIADDEDEETTVRNAVCFSLGEIGDPQAIDVLKRCFGDRTNFLLRKSALEALGKFEIDEMDSILISGLRDPIWQIRDAAAKKLGERQSEVAIDILKYKSKKDPEVKIRKSAIRALGDINSKESKEYLKELYLDKKSADSSKIIAIDKLIEHDVNWILPTIKEEYTKVIDKKRKPVMDNTIKFLSKKEFSGGEDFFSELLNSENYLYRVYAIQGIKLNSYKKFKDQIETMSKEDKNKNVKKQALSALEEL